MKALKKGTTSWHEANKLAADEVEFTGTWLCEADRFTPAMVWDDALNNARPMTQADRDARTAAQAAARKVESKASLDSDERLKGILQWALGEINTLRSLNGLPTKTMLDVRASIRTEIDR